MPSHFRFRATLLSVSFVCLATSAHAFKDPDRLLGDVAQYGLPLAGLTYAWMLGDGDGLMQGVKSMGSTLVTTEALKYAFANTALGTRPDGGPRSFPSGHTASSCSGAFFIGYRYGWTWGAPALALAAGTAASRVDERAHYLRDVVAGCALAWGYSQMFVTPREAKVAVLPELGPHYAGLTLSVPLR